MVSIPAKELKETLSPLLESVRRMSVSELEAVSYQLSLFYNNILYAFHRRDSPAKRTEEIAEENIKLYTRRIKDGEILVYGDIVFNPDKSIRLVVKGVDRDKFSRYFNDSNYSAYRIGSSPKLIKHKELLNGF